MRISLIAITFLVLCSRAASASYPIYIVGNVYCTDEHGSKQIAGGVTVELEDIESTPYKVSGENGFFEIRAPLDDVYEAQINILFFAGAQLLRSESIRVGGPRVGTLDKHSRVGFKMPRTFLTQSCRDIALHEGERTPTSSSDHKHRGVEAGVSGIEALQYLGLLALGPLAPPVPIITRIDHHDSSVVLSSLPLQSGDIQFKARTTLYPSLGFRYASYRDVLPMQSSNAAVEALGGPRGLSVDVPLAFLSDSAYHANLPLGETNSLSIGYHFRVSRTTGTIVDTEGDTNSQDYYVHEGALVTSFSRLIAPTLSVGLSVKLHYGTQQYPDHFAITEVFGTDPLDPQEHLLSRTAEVRKVWRGSSVFDSDMSIAWDATPRLRLGVALLGVFDQQLENASAIHDGRTIGGGVVLNLDRVTIGGDVEVGDHSPANASFGISIMPANHIECGFGLITYGRAVRWMVRLRSLQVSYILGDGTNALQLGTRLLF